MDKYYRVRSQKQYDWLMKYFEKQSRDIRWCDSRYLPTDFNFYHANRGNTVVEKNDKEELYYASLTYYQQDENVHSFIEVSDLMEDKKMENYITIKGEDLEKVHWETNYGRTSFINYDKNGEKYAHEQFLPANLSIPKSLVQQKVKMTQAEKDEFEKVQRRRSDITLREALRYIDIDVTPILFERLFNDGLNPAKSSQAQNEFARAWADPSLIEVIPEKRWNVKVPPFEKTNKYYYKFGEKLRWAGSFGNDDEDQQFTADELKEYGLDDDMYEKVEVKE